MNNLSLRIRIFISMLFIVALASVLMAIVTVNQYKKQTEEYYKARFTRKEKAAQKNIDYELENTIYPVAPQFLSFIFRHRIYEIATVHKMRMSVYGLNGRLQINSYEPWFGTSTEQIKTQILNQLKQTGKYEVSSSLENGNLLQLAYSYIVNRKGEEVGVLKVEYIQDHSAQEKQLSDFLNGLYVVYAVTFLLAILIAYVLSSYITKKLQAISEKIQETKLLNQNEKILSDGLFPELIPIVESYNQMIDDLTDSADKLAKSEREQAWREMAKQVAHEIKNPLTPMKLTVQSFERTFDPNEEGIKEKVKDYAEMLTQQIDVMSSIATSFSDFAKMPQKNIENIEVVNVVSSAVDIFYESEIVFKTNVEEVFLDFDKNQLTRVVNNLVKNAIQATEHVEDPCVTVELRVSNKHFYLYVKDNGKGISKEDEERIFEPKFTTKSSGMGLGLPMVKNIVEAYEGTIEFQTVLGLGTTFEIKIPIQ